MARSNRHSGLALHQPSAGILMPTGVKYGRGYTAPTFGAELWVNPPTTHNGATGYYDHTGTTITLNRDLTDEGNFQSDATLTSGTQYRLEFDFARAGGTYPDYAVVIQTTSTGIEILTDLAPATEHFVVDFTMPETAAIQFVCPDAEWSARYIDISLKAFT